MSSDSQASNSNAFRQISLRTEVQFLPGVSSERAALLAKLGVRTAADLVFLFPRSHEAPTDLVESEQFEVNTRASFLGTVLGVEQRTTASGKHMLGAQVATEDGKSRVRLLWFNQPFRSRDLWQGRRLLATGVLKSTVLNWEMVQPQVRYLEKDELPESEQPQPVYPLTEGLKQYQLRALMRQALPPIIDSLQEVLPESIRMRLDVPGIREAANWLHFPESLERADDAIRRFKLQELFVLQLAISLQRIQRESSALAPECEPYGKLHSRILNRLGVTLTQDQLAAIDDVGRDMARSVPMNRLLQGDVGSGKTVVAQYAMLLCVAHGFQAALMAPTDVLAHQHARTLGKSLASSSVQVELLTGSLTAARRRDCLKKIAAGKVDLVVGTQALLSDKIEFPRLGLVIVDEQHKFGVLQRAKLRVEEQQPHYLVLSATPIPRTIAMTEFGDLDVSVIREKPPGRAPVKSYISQHHELDSWWRFVEGKLKEGRQAFVIAPRVGATESSPADSEPTTKTEETATAEGVFRVLQSDVFQHRNIGLLHGRMSGAEKEAALRAFAEGEFELLVATTVVEVGIDVPNATVMTILDANRLGLSQLHQLRGRVGRGSLPGFACAVASAGCDAEEHKRLKAFECCTDGFELAELDLKLRGPGDLLGTSQSGLPPMRVANLVEDQPFLELARLVAQEVLQQDQGLAEPEFKKLKRQVLLRYGNLLSISDVG
ncbi:MAG: ATP-dependent DNA helicase RecG [Planctomycetota bacterium]|nr:ATP-dependent DNA helicase RecG [Planctomycetota bacterium]